MSDSPSIATVVSLDYEGRGVARMAGKAIFIEGALPGEVVEFVSYRRKPTFEQATLLRVLRPSGQRRQPPCPHFDECGGCSMQHLDPAAQIAIKQRTLEDALWHIGRLHADEIYAPIVGSPFAYRQRARLSAFFLEAKAQMLLGFYRKRSTHVADIAACLVMPPLVSGWILPLRKLLNTLSVRHRIPQIEVSTGDAQTVLVLRHLIPLAATDKQKLREFADALGNVWYLQPGGPETARRFYPEGGPPLSYCLPEFDIRLEFSPTEFTQVNHAVNRMLVRRAMALLRPTTGERIGDFFCGLGNFSLPLARLGAEVIGIEGSAQLVRRAADNAASNGLAARCRFQVGNLFEITEDGFAALGHFDKLIIDPPRDGAIALVKALPAAGGPRSIVYISCNPATLARDAAVLVNCKGYTLRGAGIANMFPQTSHVESIALFERAPGASAGQCAGISADLTVSAPC